MKNFFSFILIMAVLCTGYGQTPVKKDLELDNWSFELGLTLWQVGYGTAFSNQPVVGEQVTSERVLTNMELSNGGIGGDYWKGMIYPIGIKGQKWIGTYEGQGDAPTGSLYSEPFILTKRFVSGLVGGGRIPQKIRVELQMKKTDFDGLASSNLAKTTLMIGENLTQFGATGLRSPAEDGDYITVKVAFSAKNMEELQRFQWSLPDEAIGKTFRIKILDDASDGWGHINVDDIRFTDAAVDVIDLGIMKYDMDKPVFGFADTHTHPTDDLGFGGKTVAGSAGGDISVEFSNQKCYAMHGLAGRGE